MNKGISFDDLTITSEAYSPTTFDMHVLALFYYFKVTKQLATLDRIGRFFYNRDRPTSGPLNLHELCYLVDSPFILKPGGDSWSEDDETKFVTLIKNKIIHSIKKLSGDNASLNFELKIGSRKFSKNDLKDLEPETFNKGEPYALLRKCVDREMIKKEYPDTVLPKRANFYSPTLLGQLYYFKFVLRRLSYPELENPFYVNTWASTLNTLKKSLQEKKSLSPHAEKNELIHYIEDLLSPETIRLGIERTLKDASDKARRQIFEYLKDSPNPQIVLEQLQKLNISEGALHAVLKELNFKETINFEVNIWEVTEKILLHALK